MKMVLWYKHPQDKIMPTTAATCSQYVMSRTRYVWTVTQSSKTMQTMNPTQALVHNLLHTLYPVQLKIRLLSYNKVHFRTRK